MRPRADTVRIFGQDPLRARCEVLVRIAYVPEVPDAPPYFSSPRRQTFAGGCPELLPAIGT